MPSFIVITPVRHGASEPAQPGEIIELSAKDGAALIACGAVEAAKGKSAPAAAPTSTLTPTPTPTPTPAAKQASQTAGQLISMGKVKMTAIAATETIELPADASAKAMAEAIVAARAARTAGAA